MIEQICLRCILNVFMIQFLSQILDRAIKEQCKNAGKGEQRYGSLFESGQRKI